jgi:hypothetical protein
MNPFVNLQKRSIQLPKGCKDLMDVLRPPRARGAVGETLSYGEPFPKPDRMETGGLAHVEHYVSRLLQSAAKRKTLLISSLDWEAWCVLAHYDGVLTVTVFVECSDSVREEAVRSLFVEAGINPTTDYVMSNEGVPMRGLAYPLPADAPRATQLTADLMRRAYGLADEAGLDFLYDETDAA